MATTVELLNFLLVECVYHGDIYIAESDSSRGKTLGWHNPLGQPDRDGQNTRNGPLKQAWVNLQASRQGSVDGAELNHVGRSFCVEERVCT